MSGAPFFGDDPAPGTYIPGRLTVGRVGIDVPTMVPAQWNQSGDRISIAGQLTANNSVGAALLRQQLAGYVGNDDEPVVPVTWAEDPTVDGYYRVLSTSVASRPASLYSNLWDFAIELERVADGWRRSGFESVLTSAWAANAAGRASSNAKRWLAFPTTLTDINHSPRTIRYGADGNVAILEPSTFPVRWGIAPADYYSNAATLRVGGGVVVGDQIDSASPYGWVLSNGVMEVRLASELEAGIANRGDLAIRWRLASGWSAWKGFRISTNDSGPPLMSYATSVRVIRNSPAEVAIRITAVNGQAGSFVTVRHGYDLSLRRGSDTLAIVARVATFAHQWRLHRFVTEAASQVSGFGAQGAIVATNPDADGLRYVLASPLEFTQVLASGRVNWDLTALNTVTCAIGAVVPVVSTALTEDAARLVDRYLTSQGEWYQPIAW